MAALARAPTYETLLGIARECPWNLLLPPAVDIASRHYDLPPMPLLERAVVAATRLGGSAKKPGPVEGVPGDPALHTGLYVLLRDLQERGLLGPDDETFTTIQRELLGARFVGSAQRARRLRRHGPYLVPMRDFAVLAYECRRYLMAHGPVAGFTLIDQPGGVIVEMVRVIEADPADGASPDDQVELVRFLLALAQTGAHEVAANVHTREDHARRRMSYVAPGYRGRTMIGQDKFREAYQGPRHLLQAIPRSVRRAFRPRPGHYVDLDLAAAFLAIAATLSGDGKLAADVSHHDQHQVVGAQIAPDRHPDQQREIGKKANCVLICGGSAAALRYHLGQDGLWIPIEEAIKVHTEWWARYSALKRFVDRFGEAVDDLVAQHRPLHVIRPDGVEYTISHSDLAGLPRVQGQLPDAGWGFRRALASLWRAVEAAWLDRVLMLLHGEPWVKLVIPMYDGGLFWAADPVQGQRRVQEVAEQALAELAIAARIKVDVRAHW